MKMLMHFICGEGEYTGNIGPATNIHDVMIYQVTEPSN